MTRQIILKQDVYYNGKKTRFKLITQHYPTEHNTHSSHIVSFACSIHGYLKPNVVHF